MQCNSAQNDQRFSNVHYSLNCFSVPLQAEGRRPAIRNSQFAIRNSQFAIRNSQFAIRNSQFPSVLAHFEAGSHENQEISFVGSWLPASSISKLSQPPSLPATRLAQPLLPRQFKFLENIACVGGGDGSMRRYTVSPHPFPIMLPPIMLPLPSAADRPLGMPLRPSTGPCKIRPFSTARFRGCFRFNF